MAPFNERHSTHIQIDGTPTSGSTNLITSGTLHTSLAAKESILTFAKNALSTTDGGSITREPGTDTILYTPPTLTSYAPKASPTFTGTVGLPATTSIGSVSATEIGYLDGVSSAIQTQLNGKQSSGSYQVALESPVVASPSGTGNLTLSSNAGYNTRLTYTPPSLPAYSGNLGGTLTTAAQTNITSVGTLSNLTVSGNIGGTLTTPAQTNVTSVGALTSLSVAGTISTMYIKSPENQTAANTQAAAQLRLESGNTVGGGNSEIIIQPYGISYQANYQNFFNGTGANSCQLSVNGVVRYSSDDRLKHNEDDVTNALVIVRKLIAQKYQKTAEIKDADFNGELTEDYIEETGFIAQEVMKIPELSYCVTDGKTSSGKDIYYLNYTDIFVINVQAVEELDGVVTAQATRIVDLEARWTDLDA